MATKFNITGNTYPVKDQLKVLGCKWDAQDKAWVTTSEETFRRGMELVNGAGRIARSRVPRHSKPAKEDVRIEYPSKGATYNRDAYGVYRYDTYPKSSVLAGQQRRQFLGTYETLEEARAEYPNAELCGCGYQVPYVNHLSDGPDWIC